MTVLAKKDFPMDPDEKRLSKAIEDLKAVKEKLLNVNSTLLDQQSAAQDSKDVQDGPSTEPEETAHVSSPVDRETAGRPAFDRGDQAKQNFLMMLNHELRTPLTAIIGLTEMVTNETHGPINVKYGEYLRDVISSARELLRKIEEVLVATDIEQNQLTINPRVFSVKETLENILKKLDHGARAKNMTINLLDSGEIPDIRGDENLIELAITNIVDNAIKFGDERTSITIAINRRSPWHLSVCIADQGKGMSENTLNERLQMFSVKNPWKSRSGRGLGLGLYESKRILEKCNGCLTISSTEGVGTLVDLQFVIANPQPGSGTSTVICDEPNC